MQKIELTKNQFIARIDSDIESLIPNFLNNRKSDLVDIKAYLETKDFKNLERLGHILKGASGGYGFEKLSEYGADLETSAKISSLKDCATIADLIGIYLRDVVLVFV